ncbi:MAG: enoyl-CoA hydratase/isomerase family protein [Tissierellia bacterium]|nr:enoyl-CoA hydratase/isomerase family protein [Tissierellia bacterium]
MDYSRLKWHVEDKIGVLTLNSPETLNALDSIILNELEAWVDGPAQEETLRAIVITGEGKAFVAGADIKEMLSLDAQGAKKFGMLGSTIFRKIEKLSIPVLAAVNGFALGGGCELALCCDIRLASKRAKFGQPEVGLGITPGFSGTLRLPRVVGVAKAKELIYTAKIVGADEALSLGLVNHVVEPEELLEKTMQMARQIAGNSGSAVSKSKAAIDRGLDMDIDNAILVENDLFALCFAQDDQKEGMQAFVNKKKPAFK